MRIRSPTASGLGVPSGLAACAAGESGITLPTTGGCTRKPIKKTIMNPIAARMMFMITPADTTNIRAAIDLRL